MIKTDLIRDKKIAIIGGGPVGLTTARLLQRKGGNLTVYEREKSAASRLKGSSLDLHKQTGQKALKQAGLFEEFKKLSRPVAQLVSDMHGKVVFRMKPDKNKPEIDRPDLRKMLLESLLPRTVVWNRQVIAIERKEEFLELQFHNGTQAKADIVIIADGTMSKARAFLTESLPADTGTYVIQGEITNPEVECPSIHQMYGSSNIACVQDKKTLFTHIKAGGSICFHASFRKSENSLREHPFDFKDNHAISHFLHNLYKAWGPIYHELFDGCSDYIGYPLKIFPVHDTFGSHSDITIVGDAAHVMPPFGGMGVNMGMRDALILAENLTNGKFDTVDAAIRDYEQEMISYAAPVQRATYEADDRIHTTTAHSFERVKKNKLLELLKITQYATLISLLLVVGVFWGVWLSISRSYDLFSIPELVAVAKVMMPNLAVPMRFLSAVCVLLLSTSAYLLPNKRTKEFYFTMASIGLILMALLITIIIEVPINNQLVTWTITTVPTDFQALLDRWLLFNKIRTVAALASFVFFTTAILNPFEKTMI